MAKRYLLGTLQKLARPTVYLCLKHGIKLGELIDAIKRVYVACAEELLLAGDDGVSTSRISLMTGVHRTDVAALRSESRFTPRERHTASDVISQWRYDSRFCSKPGRPRALTVEGKESEFSQLVKSVSLSVSPYTVNFELERLGMVKRSRDGRIRLLSRVFVPKGDPESILMMLAEDAEDLFKAVEENAFTDVKREVPNHHLKTSYSNIDSSALPEIRRWLMREGSAFHERARNFLARFDRDINPTPEDKIAANSGDRYVVADTRHRVAIASFSIIEKELDRESIRPTE